MAYIDELLSRDEQVLYEGRQHAFVLIGNIVTEMFLIAILIAAGPVHVEADGDGPGLWPHALDQGDRVERGRGDPRLGGLVPVDVRSQGLSAAQTRDDRKKTKQ